MKRRRYRQGLGQQNSEVTVLTEGPEAKLLTILEDHPNWGGTSCLNTQNVTTSAGQIQSQFDSSRILTKKDADLISRNKGRAIAALQRYKAAAETAKTRWNDLAEEYAEIAEQCNAGTREYDSSETGVVIALHPRGFTGDVADCVIAETGKLQGTKRVNAMRALDEVGVARREAFRLCDFLMVNAMRPQDAANICQAKTEAFQETRRLLDEANRAAQKMDQIRNEAFQSLQSTLTELLEFFQRIQAFGSALVRVVERIIEVVEQVADTGAGAIAKAASFFLRHPNLLLVLGGIVGLGVLAFVLRPYITVISAVFGGH